MQCGDCEKEYLGQSKRQFGTRLKEHTVSKVCLWGSVVNWELFPVTFSCHCFCKYVIVLCCNCDKFIKFKFNFK